MRFTGVVNLDRTLMHSSPRNIRKGIKAKFQEMRPPRKTAPATFEQLIAGYGPRLDRPHHRAPAIYGLRVQRTQSRQARLALSGNGRRLPPYIRTLLRAPKAAGPRQVPSGAIAPGWPHEYPELERVDRLLAEVRELGNKPADGAPPSHGTDRATDREEALSDVVVAVASTPSDALPDHQETTAAAPKVKVADRKERQFVEARALQDRIAGEVRAQPGCEAFVGVLLEKVKPNSTLDPNWDLLGVKFGKADRKTVNDVLATVILRMKSEFGLSDEMG